MEYIKNNSTKKISDIFCENSKSKITGYKEYLKIIFGYKCDMCDLDKWNNKEIILEIDHINGIRNDNRIENLRFLCPNCHSQTETFRGKNKKYIKNKDGNFKYLTEDIINGVSACYNLRELCLYLNISPKGGNYNTLRRKIEELNIVFKETKKTIKEYRCQCGKIIDKRSKQCKSCVKIGIRKVERPPYDQLIQEIKSTSYASVGRKYRVSDNAIRKWVISYQKDIKI